MARGFRVVLKPINGSSPGSVVGALVSLERRGAGTTKGIRGATVPAKLTFFASCFDKARKPERKEAELGSVTGELSLSKPSAEPSFLVASGDPFASELPKAEPGKTPRTLRLQFSSDVFRLPAELATSMARLVVPAELMDGARHLELFVELEVAGAAEGARDANDILDVPLVPRPRHIVRVVDEIGEPLTGVPALFEAPDLSESVTTDGEGRCAIDQLGPPSVDFRITDDAGIRSVLKERWNGARKGAPLRASRNTTVVSIDSALDAIASEAPFVRTLSIQPNVGLARLVGMFFDTNKSFLLPGAMPDMVRVKELYDEHPESELLIVGHTDTSGDPSVNDPLSLERAESVAAFLKDEVDVWLERYSTKISEKRRWGPVEDLLMLQSLGDFFERPEEEAPVSWFQRTRGLTVNGIAGPETRRALILEYMAHDETTLPPGVSVTSHGCGEFFPLEETGQAIDPDPKNPERDAADRRVELYFFDKEFGIQPPPSGKNSSKGSTQYPEWRKRAEIRHESEMRLSDRMLRVRLQVDGKPIADEEYALDVDGRRVTVARTDTDGLVVQRLPVDAALAQIRVPRLGLLRSIRIEPTEVFPPVTDLTGAQIRLAQLGFLTAEPTGLFDELTQEAIIAFRKERGLSASPELDADTERELVAAYGS